MDRISNKHYGIIQHILCNLTYRNQYNLTFLQHKIVTNQSTIIPEILEITNQSGYAENGYCSVLNRLGNYRLVPNMQR